MQEIWKSIEGYENYEVSTLGNVKNIKTGKLLKPRPAHHGYLRVCLWNPNPKDFKIHRLVAKTFIPNPFNLDTVDHINGITYQNNVENLQWMTRSENSKKAKIGKIGAFKGKHHSDESKLKISLAKKGKYRGKLIQNSMLVA